MLCIKRTQHEDFRDELVNLKGSEVLPKKISWQADGISQSWRENSQVKHSSGSKISSHSSHSSSLEQIPRLANPGSSCHNKQSHAGTNQILTHIRLFDHSRKKCSEESGESVTHLPVFQDHIPGTKDGTSPRGASDTISTIHTCRYQYLWTYQERIARSWEVLCRSIYVLYNTCSTSGAYTRDHHRMFSIGFDKDNVDKRQDWRDSVWQFLNV